MHGNIGAIIKRCHQRFLASIGHWLSVAIALVCSASYYTYPLEYYCTDRGNSSSKIQIWAATFYVVKGKCKKIGSCERGLGENKESV